MSPPWKGWICWTSGTVNGMVFSVAYHDYKIAMLAVSLVTYFTCLVVSALEEEQ
jgi:predicted branched-subunit amino acid permease